MTEVRSAIRRRSPAERAARRRKEKEIARHLASAAGQLESARGQMEIVTARALTIAAIGAFSRHHGLERT